MGTVSMGSREAPSPAQYVPSTPQIQIPSIKYGGGDNVQSSVVPDISHNLQTRQNSPVAGIVPQTPVCGHVTSSHSQGTVLHFVQPSPYPKLQSPFNCWIKRHEQQTTPVVFPSGGFNKETLQEVPCTPKPSNENHLSQRSQTLTGGKVTPGKRKHRVLYPSKRSPVSRPLQLFDGDEIFI